MIQQKPSQRYPLLSIDFISKGRKRLREGSVDAGPFAAEPHSTPSNQSVYS